MSGAVLVAMAVFFLGLAVMPPGRRRSRAALDFIRASTTESELEPHRRASTADRLLRGLTERLPVRQAWVSRQDMVAAGIDVERFPPEEVAALKLLLAGVALVSGLVLGTAAPGIFALAPALAWTGFVLPSLYIRRRRAARRAEILRELPDLVGLLRAFLNAQVPLEQALHLISEQLAAAAPGNILGAELRLALGDYGLGRTIERACRRWRRGSGSTS